MAKSKHDERVERTIANYERSLHRLALALKAIREQVLLEWDYLPTHQYSQIEKDLEVHPTLAERRYPIQTRIWVQLRPVQDLVERYASDQYLGDGRWRSGGE